MAAKSGEKLMNVGPKSAAWMRQVGIHGRADLAKLGAVRAFVKIKRAGFRPSLNLLYALEGALLDCHWQQLPDERRSELLIAADAALAELPDPRKRPAGAVVELTGEQFEAENVHEHERLADAMDDDATRYSGDD